MIAGSLIVLALVVFTIETLVHPPKKRGGRDV